MMISKPLARSLALAAVALLPLRAAAAGDAAFLEGVTSAAAHLRTIQELRAAAPAAPKGPAVKAPAADEGAWAKVIAALQNKDLSVYEPEAPPIKPGSFTLSIPAIDPKADPKVIPQNDHSQATLAAIGLNNDDDKFEVMGVVILSSDYKTDPSNPDNFIVDQWIFETDVYGQVQNAAHGTVVLPKKGGQPLSRKADPLKPGDPRIDAKFQALVKQFSELKAKP